MGLSWRFQVNNAYNPVIYKEVLRMSGDVTSIWLTFSFGCSAYLVSYLKSTSGTAIISSVPFIC